MGQGDRLGPLQMSVTRQKIVDMILGLVDEAALDLEQGSDGLKKMIPGVEPQIGGDLVVAGAGGMKLAAGRPDPLGELGLDVEMDVFLGHIPTESPAADVAVDRLEAGDDLLGFGAF